MKILGISAYYHDSASCLVVDGEIVAAAQEERFTRRKHDQAFPVNAVACCLSEADVEPRDLDYIVFYEKPFVKFERLLETYLAFAPRGFKSFRTALPVWLKEKLFQKSLICGTLKQIWGKEINWGERLLFSEHHLSHAASAFFPSPFHEAAVLTMDGVGEWATMSLGIGKGNKIQILKELHFPHSLGFLYSAFTYYTGFRVNSGEYKVMGLAPYGRPRYVEVIKDNLIDIKEDGTFRLDMHYFDYCTGLTMTGEKFNALFGGPPRSPESEISQRDMDLAASIQVVTEEIVIKLAKSIADSSGQKNLCLAGGVALNCVANGKLLREKIFENIWMQPAAGDAGGAVGAALSIYYAMLDNPRRIVEPDAMNGTFLGPAYGQKEIEKRLASIGAKFTTLNDSELLDLCANALAEGKALGWHQGRMEFGPRALGARSILGDARSPSMQKTLNLRVKYRESFRPFAPSVLCEDLPHWFELDTASPYMLLVADVHKSKIISMSESQTNLPWIEKINIARSTIPAVTHLDYSARIQTVHKETNPKYYQLLLRFKELTGCPVLVNTSFNVRGEPIVATPEDAFRCFMGTDIEALAIGNCFLTKEQQDPELKIFYHKNFSLD